MQVFLPSEVSLRDKVFNALSSWRVGTSRLDIPSEATLRDMNTLLYRVGMEAVSKFPGLSVRFCKRGLRVRGGRVDICIIV